MNAADTIIMAPGMPSVVGAYILVVSFAAGEPDDKVVSITATDNITDTALNPAQSWTFSSIDVPVMNACSTAQYLRPNEYTP